MKTAISVCSLILVSAGLCAGAPAAQAAQPQAPGPAGMTAAATNAASAGKTVRRAPRGQARPRLFWLRRMSVK